jgi:monofunctional biosynthetic peptidoglycan transglycosylase
MYFFEGRSYIKERIRSLFYGFNRNYLGQGTHHGGLFEQYRNGNGCMERKLRQNTGIGKLLVLHKTSCGNAAILPNPRKYAATSSSYINRRKAKIVHAL